MKKVANEQNVRSLGNVRINQIVTGWIALTFAAVLLLFIAANQYTLADSRQSVLSAKILRCHRYADQMQAGTDTLTRSLWRFAATEDTAYVDDYLNELFQVRSRDHAMEQIKAEGATEQELEQMAVAKERSDQLKDSELYYIRLIYDSMEQTEMSAEIAAVTLTEEDESLSLEEKKAKAMVFAFGQDYMLQKENINAGISEFSNDLTGRMEQELTETMEDTQTARRWLFVALAILLVWAALFWAVFRRSVVHPMRDCIVELKEENRELPLTLRGPYELQQLVGAFNYAIKRVKDKNREIEKIKMEDPLTGGFSAVRFDMAAEEYIKSQYPFVFVSMDIKRFKLINEMFGKEAGNNVLRKVHQVIHDSLKPGEFVARYRADVFNIILQDEPREQLEQRISALISAIAEGFQGEKWQKYHMAISCGIYQVHPGEDDITTIRGRGNIARKKHKKEAALLSPCVFYSEREWERMIVEQSIENQMERALAEEEFQVFLQPKVSLADERAVGMEALVRWRTKDGTMIPPDDFIPLFEENGFIIQLDYYMFRHVCALQKKWMNQGKRPLPISVNLSREHMKKKGFVKLFQQIQQEYGVPPKYLEFEVTEAMVVENLESLKEVIAEFNAAGFRCSMDDFGSGYSSLNMLREIPLDVLKLDRDFFTGQYNERGDNVIKAVLKMAHELNMKTVAEGVETREWVEFLKREGCDMVQGYVFYRPMPVEEIERKILNQGKDS